MTERSFNSYFSMASRLIRSGQVRSDVLSAVPSFPQMMVVTTLPDHFAVELVGGDRFFRPLKTVRRKLDNPDIYFGQFNFSSDKSFGVRFTDSPNAKIDDAPLINLVHLAIVPSAAQQEMSRRFPQVLQQYATTIILASDDLTASLTFAGQGRVAVNDALLANTYDGVTRIRHVQLAVIVPKRSLAKDYESYLNRLLQIGNGHELLGARLLSAGKADVIFKASQFANIYLMNDLHETSIGFFIEQNREILLAALGALKLESEPYLPWLVPAPGLGDDTAINPDLFVQRPDGYWDVYELKLPLLNRKDITTGERKRRRFVASIEDGIAQLAHYREFLSVPEHEALALAKYGVKFKNPCFTVIVGNYENVDTEKVREAKRRFPEVEIVDYDSLLQLYLINKGALVAK
jgi:hypothetical protein